MSSSYLNNTYTVTNNFSRATIWSRKTVRFFAMLLEGHVLLRICYDALLSYFCLGLAFSGAILVNIIVWHDQQYDIGILPAFKSHFVSFGLLLPVITVIFFYICGLYKKTIIHNNKVRRSIIIICAITAGVLTFYAITYMNPLGPRPLYQVTILSWVFMIFFLAVPRFVKYILFRNVVFEANSRNGDKPTNVLVIGGAGYIGSCLVSDLLTKGYQVRILDSLLFGSDSLKYIMDHRNCELIVGDFRNAQTLIHAARDMDAIVHLAGIVGDPACSLDDDLTIDVNLTATTLLVETCKLLNITRLVFASTCSVYGRSEDSYLTEESEVNPVSLYAKTKIAAEWMLLEQSSELFLPTILRFGTLFGLSPRPRFDLVVNLLTAKAVRDQRIQIFGGTQWRPFVHVKDASKSIIAVLEAPLSKVGAQIFNVGSNGSNHQICEIGEMVAAAVDGTELNLEDKNEDERNYIVSFHKLENTLNIKLDTTVLSGIEEIKMAFLEGRLKSIDCPEYSNLIQTEKLLARSVNGCEAGGRETIDAPYKKTSRTFLQERYFRSPPGVALGRTNS